MMIILFTLLCSLRGIAGQSAEVFASTGDLLESFDISDCNTELQPSNWPGRELNVGQSGFHFRVEGLSMSYSIECKLRFTSQVLRRSNVHGFIKLELPPMHFFDQVAQCDREGVRQFVKVFVDGGEEVVAEQTFQEQDLICYALFHFDSNNGEVDVVRFKNPQTDDGLLLMEPLYKERFEFLAVQDCYSINNAKSKTEDDVVTHPRSFMETDEIFSGSSCYINIDMRDEDCATVLDFNLPPFKGKVQCESFSFTAWSGDELISTYDCSTVTDSYAPAWVIDTDKAVVKVTLGDFEQGTIARPYTRDSMQIAVKCMHHVPDYVVCSEECADDPSGKYLTPCWSLRATDCYQCRYARDEDMCVSTCTSGKFENNKVCMECHPNCQPRTTCKGTDEADCNKLCKTGQARVSLEDGRVGCDLDCPIEKPYSIFNTTGTEYEPDDEFLEDVLDPLCVSACPANQIPVPLQGTNFTFCRPQGNKDDGVNYLLVILLPAALSAMFVIFVVLILWGIKKHKKQIQRKKEHQKDFYIGDVKASKGVANRGKLRILERDEILLDQVVGQGAFGKVYSAIWRPKEEQGQVQLPVAVKQLHSAHTAAEVELLEEAALMASVDCENLVRLVAICMSEPMMLITKFMVHGCAIPFIKKHKQEMTSYQFMEWSRQLANGMAHLEARGMIHRDLAGRNVLVESPRLIRISDFGLSKILDAEKDQETFTPDDDKLPIRWLAKECLVNKTFSHKSDVWAYGVTLWEFYTYGMRPYNDQTLQQVREIVIKGRRLVQPPTCSLDLYTILLKCWMGVPENRPSFVELEEWFAQNRSHASKYFFTEKKDEPVGADGKKMQQSNKVRLGNTGSSSLGSNEKATVEADRMPRDRVARAEHTGDTSIPNPETNSDDYLVPQSNFAVHIPDEEYMRPIPRQNTNLTSVESEDIPNISLESSAARAELQKHFPQMNPDDFHAMNKRIDYQTPASEKEDYDDNVTSNYLGMDGGDRGSTEYMDRKDKVRVSKRWKQKPNVADNPAAHRGDEPTELAPKPNPRRQGGGQQQQQQGRTPSGQTSATIAPADSMRRHMPTESTV